MQPLLSEDYEMTILYDGGEGAGYVTPGYRHVENHPGEPDNTDELTYTPVVPSKHGEDLSDTNICDADTENLEGFAVDPLQKHIDPQDHVKYSINAPRYYLSLKSSVQYSAADPTGRNYHRR